MIRSEPRQPRGGLWLAKEAVQQRSRK